MPPPTAASKRNVAPDARARRSSSGPWLATMCLFAVTTLLPAARAAATSVWAGSAPPIVSTTMSMSGLATRCAGASVSRSAGMPDAIARSVAFSATAVSTSGRPSAARGAGPLEEGAHDLAADGAGADDADAQGLNAHGGSRSWGLVWARW